MLFVSLLTFLFLLPIAFSVDICRPGHCDITFSDIPSAKQGAPNTFTIGYIAGSEVPPDFFYMARWSIFQVNNNMSILPDTRIKLYYGVVDSSRGVVVAIANMIERQNIKALLVDLSEADTQLVASVATAYNVSVLSISSSSNSLDSKAPFDNLLARMNIADSYECSALLSMLDKQNISRVLYVYSQNVYGLAAASDCVSTGLEYNITVIPVSTNGNDSRAVVKNYITDEKVIFIAAKEKDGFPLLHAIQEARAYGKEYYYILSLALAINVRPVSDFPILDGTVFMVPAIYEEDNPYYWRQYNGWMDANPLDFPGARPPVFGHGWTTMDAATIYARTIETLVSEGIHPNNLTGPQIHKRMLELSHISCYGSFTFENNADRPGKFFMYNELMNEYGNATNGYRVGYYSSAGKEIYFVPVNYTYYNGSTTNPYFVTRFNEKCNFQICNFRGNCSASAECVCDAGFTGQYCERKTNKFSTALMAEIVAPVISAVSVVVVLALLYIRKRRRDLVKEVKDKQRSDIPRSDLKLLDRIGRGASGEVMKGLFRGTDVAVKRLLTNNATKAAIDEFSLEIAIMCGLRHPNIIMFMGSFFDPVQKEMLLVMELMTRGSLHDVLHDKKVDLPFDLQLHLALQAAQGMNFLHSSSPPIVHCDLKSHNILLDDKWTARISDFGITRLKESFKNKTETENRSTLSNLGTIFWTSPEVLDGKSHSEKSDCYAFGMVLWELFHRKTPYDGLDLMTVALEVVSKGLRPPISDTCPLDIQRLIRICWHQDPRSRPSFQEIVNDLRQLVLLNPLHNLGNHSSNRVQAPTGEVYLVNTVICDALTMMDIAPRAAEKATSVCNHHLRTTMESYGGYEVQAQPHKMMVSFPNMRSALDWCISVQVSLMHLTWPSEILALPYASRVTTDQGELLWQGPRLRMAVHSGAAQSDKDHLGRAIYKGPVVDRGCKLLAESNTPGIFVTSVVYEELSSKDNPLTEPIVPCEFVNSSYTVTPQKLAKRKFISEGLNLNSPADSSIEAFVIDGGKAAIPPWYVPMWNELQIMAPIGRGSIGDYSRALWRGQEVAVKALVNQKLHEEDMIKLVGDASVLSKIKHPNLASFLGVCVEEHHISIVMEYVPRNLRAVLDDNSTSVSLPQALRVARDIAAGMQYLSSHPDPEVRIHDNFKSHNVMVSKNWEVKITDFGQSNIKDLARTMTSVSNVAWTAPEILEGEPISPESSLYSFGIILWEILTRKVPYDGEHPIKVVTKILAGHRPPIPKDKIPSQCTELMTSCWNADKRMRPSWQDIQSELTAALENLIVDMV